jgi:hypothetical protein
MKKLASSTLFATLVATMLCVQVYGQGWSTSSYGNAGNPLWPYAGSIQNEITALSTYQGGVSYAFKSTPGVYYGGDGYQIEDRWNWASGLLHLNPTRHFFNRAAISHGPNEVVVLQEREATDWESSLHLVAYDVSLGPVTNAYTLKFETTLLSIPTYAIKPAGMLENPDGSYTICGRIVPAGQSAPVDYFILKCSATGVVLSNEVVSNANFYPSDFVELQNAYYVLGYAFAGSGSQNTVIRKHALSGSFQDQFVISSDSIGYEALAVTQSNDLVLGGYQSSLNGNAQKGKITKISQTGQQIWSRTYDLSFRVNFHDILEDTDGSILAVGFQSDQMGSDGLIAKLDASGNPVWEHTYGRPNTTLALDDVDYLTKVVLHKDGGYLAGGVWGTSSAWLLHVDENGNLFPAGIRGNVFTDLDQNCNQTTGDTPLAGWIVQAYKDSTQVYFGTTDANGDYLIGCDSGNYTLTLQQPSPYTQPCLNQIPITLGYLDTLDRDFAVQETIQCGFMSVEHAAPFFRPCDTLPIHVNYCNTGTASSVGWLWIKLDTALTYISSTPPASLISNDSIQIYLGNLPEGECGQLTIAVATSCSLQAGQTLCTEAWITSPDTSCLPITQWSGALLQANVICDGDSVRFEMINIGDESMQQAQDYIIIEDAVLLRQGTFQLNQGESMEITEEANGSTFHLIANQIPNAPGGGIPIAGIEGCVPIAGQPFSIGFLPQFALNETEPLVSVQCIQVVTSFDPNDKQGFPTGFDAEHNIFADTDMEYMIRFQNTGTDTAFRVYLIDSISSKLDLASIQPGASSHSYRMTLTGNRVVRFDFPGIQLPHESVDSAGSNGFVTFRIKQVGNNQPGDVIHNSAGIYFDFNAPIITNRTTHTIHEPFIILDAQEPATPELITVRVTPNPVADLATIKLSETVNGNFSLFNSQGQLALSRRLVQGSLQISRHELVPGMYFFTVHTENGMVVSGKIAVL